MAQPMESSVFAPPCPGIVPAGAAPAEPVEGPSGGWALVLWALFLSLFAFLLASFPARNSDLWAHLAAGRRLVQGSAPVGAQLPPPAGLPLGRTWLYDLLGYGVYAVLDGPGLVFVKALLVAGLALVLLRLGRSGPGWTIPAVCTALALLTMGTRLLLQPATVSCFFLALTLWLLYRPPQRARDRPAAALPGWPLVVLFVLWANSDSAFVLGLATAALVWLGQALDRAPQPSTAGLLGRLLPPATRLLVLGAACALNPSGVYAFVPAAEGGWLGRSVSSAVTTPFGTAYFANVGLSPAALAYFPLLALGLFSFVLNLPRWHWQWFLPWLGLAVLSAVQVRTVPFFAVVAAPVLAWNLQEALARGLRVPDPRQSRLRQRGLLVLRGACVVLALAFLGCAWPGWLQGPPFGPRRWAIETAPALERGAAAMRRWHEEGKLGPHTPALHWSPETAYAFAWFCPQDHAVLDERLASSLLSAPAEGGDRGAAVPEDWTERLRAAGVHHVIVYDSDRGRLFAALDRLLAQPQRWPLLYLEGDLAVFGWRDPAKGSDPFSGWEVDLNRLAFGPAASAKVLRKAANAEPAPRTWWEAFWKPAPPRPIDRDEATQHLLHAEALRRSALRRHLAQWEASRLAGLIAAAGAGAPPGCWSDVAVRLEMVWPPAPAPGAGLDSLPAFDRQVLEWWTQFILQHDDSPPALLYLAVRAARRAVAVNPEDAQAYLVLGESYLRLLRNTRERAWSRRMPELAHLRRAQASVALNQAVFLKPDLAQAHLNLAALYRDPEVRYLDLALKHARAYWQLNRQAGPPPGVRAEVFRQRQAQLQEDLNRLAQQVQEAENTYAAQAAGLRILDRAMLAAETGLAGKALDVLLESDVAAFGAGGMELELTLLLRTGRARDVRDWTTDPKQTAALGERTYHALRAQALAALGDYAAAEEEYARRGAGARSQGQEGPRGAMALTVGQAMLHEEPPGPAPQLPWRGLRQIEFRSRVAGIARRLRQEADVAVLRGLLLLEEGEIGWAKEAFRTALACWKDEAAAASGGGLDFSGRPIAQDCLRWLE
jgi:hypothetical protein